MDRRQLLTALAALPGLSLLSLRPAAAAQGLLIQSSPLAGFQYHHGERLWPRLRVGQTVQLVREPDNRYDSQAVRIDWRQRKLGYLPARQNHAVAQLLDRQIQLTARISRLQQAQSPWDRVQLEVWHAQLP